MLDPFTGPSCSRDRGILLDKNNPDFAERGTLLQACLSRTVGPSCLSMSDVSAAATTAGSKRKKRSIWFHLHFWIGWIAALPIALICLTGTVLIFEGDLFRWEHKEHFQLEVTGSPLSVAEVLNRYQTADPPLRVNHLGIPRSPEHSYSAFCTELRPEGNRGGRVFLNPYTGELTWLTGGFSFSHLMIDIHRHLAAGRVGQQIAAISSLVLAITCVIGLVLWWPLRGRTFARALKRGQALDWHNALGLVAMLPLIIMAITGITFTWGRQIWPLLDGIQGSPTQQPRPSVVAPADGKKLPIDPIVEKALSLMPDAQWTGLQPSNRDTAAHAFFFTRKGENLQLFIDPFTGIEIKRSGEAPSGPFTWYRKNFGRLHTFATYGFFPKLIWGLLSGVGGILVITGAWVSVKRWRRSKG